MTDDLMKLIRGRIVQGLIQREGRQRERGRERHGLALLAGAHTDIWLEGDLLCVRHCCCVLARSLGKETKMLFTCYGIFSAI